MPGINKKNVKKDHCLKRLPFKCKWLLQTVVFLPYFVFMKFPRAFCSPFVFLPQNIPGLRKSRQLNVQLLLRMRS